VLDKIEKGEGIEHQLGMARRKPVSLYPHIVMGISRHGLGGVHREEYHGKRVRRAGVTDEGFQPPVEVEIGHSPDHIDQEDGPPAVQGEDGHEGQDIETIETDQVESPEDGFVGEYLHHHIPMMEIL